MAESTYIHGTTPDEQQRLAALNRLTNAPFLDFLQLDDPRLGGNARVLEIGSGLGILAGEASQRLHDGLVVGIEYSADQLRAASRDRAGLAFVQGDAHRLPLADDSFDIVYCRYLLEHVRDPLAVLKEARRVLKPGGHFFTQENDILLTAFEPDCPRFMEVWKSFVELQRRLGGDARIGRRLFGLLQSAGFNEIELSMQPEVHWTGSPRFIPWVDNLIGNIVGAADTLVAEQLVDRSQIAAAVEELQAFEAHPAATAFFYWNRARGSKG